MTRRRPRLVFHDTPYTLDGGIAAWREEHRWIMRLLRLAAEQRWAVWAVPLHSGQTSYSVRAWEGAQWVDRFYCHSRGLAEMVKRAEASVVVPRPPAREEQPLLVVNRKGAAYGT